MLATAAMLALSWTSPGQGQETVPGGRLELKLDDAIALALKNNRGLIDARLSRTIQKFALELAEERYRPTASVSSFAGASEGGDPTADASVSTSLRVPTGGQLSLGLSEPLAGRGDGSGTVTLGFSQPLLRGFGADIDTAPLRTARLGERGAVLAFRETVAGVVDSTIQAWRGLAQARRSLANSEASFERIRRQLEINRQLIEAGEMAEREILQSEADVARGELALAQSRNNLFQANVALVDILDLDSASVVQPVETPIVPRPAISVEQAIETALDHSPVYAQALLGKEIAEIGLRVTRNNQRWDLSLDANASRPTGGGTTDYSVGLQLTVPLWDRSPKLALMNARAAVARAERGLRELRQSLAIAVRQAVYSVEVGLRQIELAREARRLTEEKLEIERSKLRQGLSSTFQLSQFEQELTGAQDAEIGALAAYENALLALDRTLGTTLETWGIDVGQTGQ